MKIVNKQRIQEKGSDKFWIDCVRPNGEKAGSILISMDLLTKKEYLLLYLHFKIYFTELIHQKQVSEEEIQIKIHSFHLL